MHLTSIEPQWAHGTPEGAVEDAFSALRRRDGARLAEAATPASVRALAARVGPELDASDSRPPATSTDELTPSQAASILGRFVARLPEILTDSVRCLVVGHVLEFRLDAASPDGRGLICVDCRVTGRDDEWLSVWAIYGNGQIYREIANPPAGVAHVVLRVALEFSRHGGVPFPELLMATTQLVSGEWKLILDEECDIGLPGFRGVGFWMDEGPTT